MQDYLGAIMAEIKQSECLNARAEIDSLFNTNIKRLWYRFIIGDYSIANTLQRISLGVLADPLAPYDVEMYDKILSWAKDVVNTVPADLDSIKSLLMPTAG